MLRALSFNYIPICDQSVIINNIKNSISLQLLTAYDLQISTKSVIIAGGGPSLYYYINKIRELQKQGAKILALNEVGQFLIENHICPWGIVNISPSEDTTRCIGNPLPGVKYFLASIAPSSAFELLNKYDVRIWHTDAPGVRSALKKTDEKIISGGHTVGLRTLNFAFAMGFRNYHIFGLDSSLRAGKLHAYTSHSFTNEKTGILLQCNKRVFHCTYEMAGQASEAPKVLQNLIKNGCKLNIYGDGLLQHIWRLMRQGIEIPPMFLVRGNNGSSLVNAEMF